LNILFFAKKFNTKFDVIKRQTRDVKRNDIELVLRRRLM